jgi:hypothetical protein
MVSWPKAAYRITVNYLVFIFDSGTFSARRLALLGATVACFLCPASNVRAQRRAIPDANLAYPGLIQFPDEKASGFFISTGNSIYLVTAKHVLFTIPTGTPPTSHVRGGHMTLLSYPRDPKEPGVNIIQVDMMALSQKGEIKGHSVADVAVVHISDIVTVPTDNSPSGQFLQFIGGVTGSTTTKSGVLGVAMDAIKKYDEVLVANEVLLFGYPTSLGIEGTPQLDPQRPLLRRGIVAGLNPNRKSIIIDCPSYPGNSGGPVVEADPLDFQFQTKFMVIGVVSEFVPFEEKSINYPIPYQNVNISNSGYTIVTPMDFVLELVK